MLNKLDEFEDAVRKAVSDVRLDNDVVVSVFETNIRVLGYEPPSFSCCVCVFAVCVFPHRCLPQHPVFFPEGFLELM